ncbi:uncharacterized protein LOC127862291 isoform X1 [Dreissena polymorpha]|uniref:EF-hand domain-containing protein n=1 Tax=Dreissena polymorpha TaxID=45954 RepID=A0A9D3YA31_DREPO|nr:uncharacterized protein LOC127862291 isoform X1 [Dreissena polymorpha]KAH3695431.1 hypothetical protein DPMN_082890 [Dreissena polymorpha]
MKPKSNGSSPGGQDGFSLLDSTDSEVEWLNLPPMKGKKPKRKKSKRPRSPDQDSCDAWSVIKGLLVFMMIAGLVVLSLASVWLTKQISDMTEKMKHMETRSKTNDESSQQLLVQMAVVNKTLDQQARSIQTLAASIALVNKTVTDLKDTVGQATAGLKLAPELKLLPEKLTAVSQSVATLGSDVEGMKDTVNKVDLFMKTTDFKVQNLTQQIAVLSQIKPTPSEPVTHGIQPEVSNVIQGVVKQLEDVNSTLSGQISVLMKSNSQHQERLSQLENATKTLTGQLPTLSAPDMVSSSNANTSTSTSDTSSETFRSAVTEIVHNVLATTSSETSEDTIQLKTLVANVTAILVDLQATKDKFDTAAAAASTKISGDHDPENPDSYVTMGLFNELGRGFEDKIKVLNKSFVQLKVDLGGLYTMVTSQANSLANVSHHVQALETFVKLLSQTGTTTTLKNLNSTVTNSATTPTLESKDLEEEPEDVEAVVTSKVNTTPASMQNTDGRSTMKVPWINNLEDFDISFRRWDVQSSGQVDYKELENHLGSNVLAEAEMKKYDEDNNGLYSMQEMAKAFGIVLTTAAPTMAATPQMREEPPR